MREEPAPSPANASSETRRDYELALQVGNKAAMSAFLAQLRLQGFHQRNQDLGLDFGLLNDGNAHLRPPVLATFS